ncbi:type VI secretion system tip protein VgrG [Lentibacter algarum]|uniref:type VI secretion system Vgr family protein n=1 Tax=Lentibacter algarum TaxID=576131 RepID=UPI001C0668FA|nr:type VI secretion system tip protein TssI/VgrG [Lentibacter algarum]MBU2980574.1 type VI secretion system tip protein VgrG [Lentibacter algarum]
MPLDRIAILTTPLAEEDTLLFSSLSGADHISQCFDFTVLAHSYDPNIAGTDLLGQMVTVAVTSNPDAPDDARYFHGMVDQFRFEGNDDADMFVYRLTLRPKFWLLSKTTDNRIFQDQSVEEIVTSLLSEHGIDDFRLELSGSATEPRDYCVQFGESDLDFIQRLLEHEGAFYYFQFEEDKHTLVISDDSESLETPPDLAEIRFEPNVLSSTDGSGVITRLTRTDSIVSGEHTLTDYNFESPSSDLIAKSKQSKDHENDAMERYSYPGHYMDVSSGDAVAGVRRTEDQALSNLLYAHSTASIPRSGNLFELWDYPRDAENQSYLILSAEYDIWDGQYGAGVGRDQPEGFMAKYRLVPNAGKFRPPRTTPKPVMKGPQTARVVGPGGEEIYTDEYARVKVHFFWDRAEEGQGDTTCWIRVSAAWAGAGYGFIQIPRIGHEVIVDFLDGDPDRPIITGRVYNAEQMPPYDLPANATQSGWKSESSLGGGGFNELRFEDLKGSEEVYFQAEKDHNELVKNNESRHIGNDFAETVVNNATQDVGVNRDETVGSNKTTSVGVDRTVSIGSNDTETVGVNRSLTVGADETIGIGSNSTETIGVNHTQTVGAVQTITVGVARIDSVGAAETRSVGGPQTNTIGATRQMTVGATQSHEIGATDSWEIGAGQSVKIGADQGIEVAANHSLQVGADSGLAIGANMSTTVAESKTVEVGTDLVVKAADSITFTCGDAKFQMKKDGTIVLEGKDLTIKGSGKINITASGDITMKGSKINQN